MSPFPRHRGSIAGRALGVLCLLGGFVWTATPVHAAVGIAPVSLDFKEALRGGTFAQTLLLSNEPSTDAGAVKGDAKLLEFKVKAQGEITDWVSFSVDGTNTPNTSFKVAKADRVVVRVQVKVPPDTANRTYKGTIFVEAVAVDTLTVGQSGSGVGTAAEIPIIVNVGGTERREATVQDFLVEKAEVGLKQRFIAKIRNTGNVSVAAQLDVKVSRADAEVVPLSSKGQNFPVLPAEDGSVYIDWDTADQLGGDYKAEFTASDVSGATPIALGTKTVAFRLEPRGTFTRSGEFAALTLKNQPEKGGLVVAEAQFLNSGKIATNAVFDGEITVDGKLIKTVQSLPRAVRPGETGPIGISFEAVDAGIYRIAGKINFDGEVTKEQVLEFTVKEAVGSKSGSKGTGGGSNALLFVILAAGVVVVASGLVVVSRRRRR